MSGVELSDLLGARFVGAQYDILEWEDGPLVSSVIDQVPKAVNLAFDTLSVWLHWDLRPPIERLVIVSSEEAPGPLTRRIDVSKRWGAFIGSQLVSVSWADQETSDGFQPWAVTFAFGSVGELVVALGELVDGMPTYVPDSLLVTASRQTAASYQPPASPTPAWTRAGAADG